MQHDVDVHLVGIESVESVSNGGIVIVVVAARVHGRFRLFVDNAPYRGFKLRAMMMRAVACCVADAEDGRHTRVNTSPIFFSNMRSLASITLSGSSVKARVRCVSCYPQDMSAESVQNGE
jgi:hypothetical protein